MNNPGPVVITEKWFKKLIREQVREELPEINGKIDSVNKKVDALLEIAAEHRRWILEITTWIRQREAALDDEDKRPPAKEKSPVKGRPEGTGKTIRPYKTTVDDGTIKALYQAEWAIGEIARELNVSELTIKDHLKGMGLIG